ncbi:hypothetical protein LKMONMHP_0546 [Methylobacterium organophilum]|uniref:Lectin-like protein BA14k n=2 Tax=Methylobacterium organophilum TaxID=410 RepID=A0ABQ4T242_METOR|nr:hypothetical protein LKMONMHP_0546 [Methylobacterium organophilum]
MPGWKEVLACALEEQGLTFQIQVVFMRRIATISAIAAGALLLVPALAEAQGRGITAPTGGIGGIGASGGGGGLRGGGAGLAGGGFRGGGAGLAGGGFRGGAEVGGGGFRGGGAGLAGGGFAGRPGFGAGRPGFGNGVAGVRPGLGNGVAGVRPGLGNRGWYGGNRWRNAGWHRRGYGYGGLGLGLGVGAGLGLAAGGLYGAGLYGDPGYGYGYGYDNGYYAPAGYYGTETVETGVAPGGFDDAVAECARRFKTYDPQSQTYIVRRGVRRSCP